VRLVVICGPCVTESVLKCMLCLAESRWRASQSLQLTRQFVHCKSHAPRTAMHSLFAGRRTLTAQASAGLRGGACTSTKPRCSCSATSAVAPCCRAATPTSCPPRARCGAAWGGRRPPSCRSAGPAPPLPTRCRLPLTPRPPTPLTSACSCSGGQTPSACRHPRTHASQLTGPVAWPAPRRASDVSNFWGREPGSSRTRRSTRSLVGASRRRAGGGRHGDPEELPAAPLGGRPAPARVLALRRRGAGPHPQACARARRPPRMGACRMRAPT